LSFGDAIISEKHMNFFVNKKDASFKDMKKLIYTVQEKVQKKTGININPEIIIVE
jgi:UDP-N-acetylmuramate dehydrogenase